MKNKLRKLSLIISMVTLMVLTGISQGGIKEAKANHVTESNMYSLYLLNAYETSVTYNLAPGTAIVMHPNSNRIVYTYLYAENMIKSNSVKTIVMPGVGSSSSGAAALAKQVANELNEPVAAIVTGWGDSSTWYYGTQGYYIGRDYNESQSYYYNAASEKLASLYESGARPHRLVGHSKGSMDIANGLFKLKNENKSSLYNAATFISLGIGVNVPSGLANYKGFIGSADSLGSLNTTNTNNLTVIDGKGHYINALYLNYLPVTAEMLVR